MLERDTTPALPSAPAERAVVHFRRGEEGRAVVRAVVTEAPLVIAVEGHGSYTIMRTPGQDLDLATGFLFAEGLLDGIEDIESMRACEGGDTVKVRLARPASPAATRNLVVQSSCGLCGRDGVGALLSGLRPVGSGIDVPLDVLYALPDELRRQQALFESTGGCHAAALFTPGGRVLLLGEDLGRHSALDKVLGRALRDRVDTTATGILLSGRTSLEMVVKAARSGVSVVVAISAASDAAIDTARRLGITLCGFARGDEVAVYCHERRVVTGPAQPE